VIASDRVRAIAPCVTTTDYYTTPWYSDGGALSWHSIQSWSTMMALAEALRQLGRGVGDPQLLADLGAMLADPQPHLEALPPSRQPVLEKVWPWWSELLSHPSRDQFWQDLSVLDQAGQVTVPALHIGGWFDIFAANTARSFTELRSRAGTLEAREGQRLIIGPWDHLNSTGVSSAPDTDFTGKLVDVFPDGRAIYLTDGILRARYRDSLAEPEPLTPGQPYELSLDLSVTSNVFLPGHRIRLEVSSSNFPRFDRNTNTGGLITGESADQVTVAVNRVLHGPEYPSRLILPVIRR
jgi:predicted acyl esterase